MSSLKLGKQLIKYFVLFSIGGLVYVLCEILWRGHSHISMLALGGICFIIIGNINNWFSWEMPLLLQMLVGACIITTLEFVSGCVLNLWLGLDIWNYSDLKFNFLGQISLTYSCIWFLLSGVGIVLDDYLRYWLFHEQKPHYKIL